MVIPKALTMRTSDDWCTPPDLYEKLNQEFEFDYDPCPLKSADNALFLDWGRRVFCNPPYSNIRPFIEKGLLELKRGNSDVVVFLVPSRTDTAWFHDLVWQKAELRFIRNRVLFLKNGEKVVNKSNRAPFPCMIIIFRRDAK